MTMNLYSDLKKQKTKNRNNIILTIVLTLLIGIGSTIFYYDQTYNLQDGQEACIAWGYDDYHGVSFSRLMSLKDPTKPYPEGILCWSSEHNMQVMISGRDQNGTIVD